MKKREITLLLAGVLLAGGLIGYESAAKSVKAQQRLETSNLMSVQQEDQKSDLSVQPDPDLSVAFAAEDTAVYGGEDDKECIDYAERLKEYEPFGMTYNADTDELRYKGALVRWFEDYFPVNGENEQAGIDFFNEKGIVDIYAVRDLENLVHYEDGSFDPSGKLIGLREFSQKEFDERDIEAIKNPPVPIAYEGEAPSAEEMKEVAKEYEVFGVTYDADKDQWYFNGEKVRYFEDIMSSNGESLTGGKFRGSMRMLQSADGEIEICTVRDFEDLDASGNGRLIGIEKCENHRK